MRPLSRSRQARVWRARRAAVLAFVLAFVLAATALAPPLAIDLAAEPARTATSYTNQKYGFSLTLPGGVLAPANAPNSEEGAIWESADGMVRLLAVAGFNASNDTLSSYRAFVMEQSYKGATFDYAPVRDTWFVLSGQKDERMFYERISFACNGRYIYGWQLTYPAAERQRYDRLVEQIHRSYRPGRGEDGRCGRGGREPS